MYDFDKLYDRNGTGCYKYDALSMFYKKDDIIPLWVADMDFAIAPEITKAMEERLKHPVYGYNFRPDSYYQSIINWVDRRHGWKIQKDWITNSPGIVPGINFVLLEFTKPGDKVLIQEPVYSPFRHTVLDHKRELVVNELINNNGSWEMDFDALDKELEGIKMFIFCSPHNPVGRMWTEEELLKLGRLCKKHNVLLFSDEIHNDLILSERKHIPIATLEDFSEFTITGIAPSKTFNIPGLMSSALIIPNEKISKQLKAYMFKLHMFSANTFGMVALEAAYNHGEAWLEELKDYLRENLNLVVEKLKGIHPELKVAQQEATYLAWVDLRFTGKTSKELNDYFLKEANIALSPGSEFGPSGEGYMRLNFALPKNRLELALDKMVKAIKEL